MFKSLAASFSFLCLLISGSLMADCCCCQSAEISLGWRRDDLNWKTPHLDSSYVCGHADSKIHFKDIDIYTISGKLRWISKNYYIRFSAEYGLTDKGRARERFKIDSPWIYYPLDIHTSDPVRRRSEVYDFDIAVGYPFTLCCCRFTFAPLIGFSFHRQQLRVKEKDHSFPCCSSSCSCSSSHSCKSRHSSSSCCCSSSSSSSSGVSDFFPSFFDSSSSSDSSSYSDFFNCHSSSSFFLSSCNPFVHSPSSDPFESPSSPNIASVLGLSNPHRMNHYRYSWYGFYLGADALFALDPCWALFGEFEGHFLNNCHRKRKSLTGVYFVDDYHRKGWAYGFNSVFGLTYDMCACWYSIVTVEYKWWKAHSKHDELHWESVGVKLGLGYVF